MENYRTEILRLNLIGDSNFEWEYFENGYFENGPPVFQNNLT
jgi:hypothetical protein